jgi:hypothetical protein
MSLVKQKEKEKSVIKAISQTFYSPLKDSLVFHADESLGEQQSRQFRAPGTPLILVGLGKSGTLLHYTLLGLIQREIPWFDTCLCCIYSTMPGRMVVGHGLPRPPSPRSRPRSRPRHHHSHPLRQGLA